MGIGDWGLGVWGFGGWGRAPRPTPPNTKPHPQSLNNKKKKIK